MLKNGRQASKTIKAGITDFDWKWKEPEVKVTCWKSEQTVQVLVGSVWLMLSVWDMQLYTYIEGYLTSDRPIHIDRNVKVMTSQTWLWPWYKYAGILSRLLVVHVYIIRVLGIYTCLFCKRLAFLPYYLITVKSFKHTIDTIKNSNCCFYNRMNDFLWTLSAFFKQFILH